MFWRDRRLWWGLFALAATALLLLAALLAVREALFLQSAIHTTGTVVDTQNQGGAGDQSSYPVVTFTTNTGEPVTFQSNASGPGMDVGAKVPVAYLAGDPQGTAQIDEPFLEYLPSIVLGALALIGLGIAGAGLALSRVQVAPRRRPKPKAQPATPPRPNPLARIPNRVWVGAIAVLVLLGLIGSVGLTFHPATPPANATGTIVGFRDDSDSNQYPIVQFTTPDGRQHTFTSGAGSNPSPYHEGDRVGVYYNPKDPGSAVVADTGPNFVGVILSIICATALFILGVFLLIDFP